MRLRLHRTRSRRAGWVVGLQLAGLLAAAVPTTPLFAADPEEAFAVRALRVPGRAVEAHVLPADAAEGGARLVVVALEGQPPEEHRRLVVYGRDLTRPPHVHTLGPEVVAFDGIPPRAGAAPATDAGEPEKKDAASDGTAAGRGEGSRAPRILALTAEALVEIGPSGDRRSLALEPPLPLPPRTREVSRLAFARDWDGDGRLDALLPAPGGVRLLPGLDPEAGRFLALPQLAEYLTPAAEDPVDPAFFEARLVWPSLALADDDGDGRDDLFASSRYALHVLRAGPYGLPERSTRRARLPALPFDEERRPESSQVRLFTRDLDGDGRADLVVHRTAGTALRAEATTTLHHNPGDGARPDAPPDLSLASPGGLAAIALRDLDGDGRVEVVQTFVPFGVMQLVRVLTRGVVEAELRVHRIQGPGLASLAESFRVELRYGLDLAAGVILGVLPTLEGDFDGDGRADLLHADGPDAVRIRLGEAGEEGPRFGPPRVRLELPGAREVVVADLDGDGLDDLVAWNPLDREGRLWWARNRGLLGEAGVRGGEARDPGGLHPLPE